MRRLLFLLLVLTISKSYAQDNIYYGVKAGGNVTYLWGQGTKETTVKPIAGFHVGGFLNYRLNEKLSVQPELLFATRGIHVQNYTEDYSNDFYVNNQTLPTAGYSTDGPYSYRTKVNIFYLDLPVAITYQVIEKLRISAGPMISMNIWDSYPKTYTNENIRIQSDKSYSKIKPFEFSAFIGASYDLNLMEKEIAAGARYSLGLTRINEAVRGNDDLKSSQLQIFLAYKISNL
jgi:hypothetical protein